MLLMESDIEIQVKLFGPFRSLSLQEELTLVLPQNSTSVEVRQALEPLLKNNTPTYDVRSLLAHSVFADENHVLEETDPIHSGMHLAVLPPVCGG